MSTIPQTPAQTKFLQELFTDLERQFFQRNADKTSGDFVAWFGGLLKRHIAHATPKFYRTHDEILTDLRELPMKKARRLIGALIDVRANLDHRTDRTRLKTPKPLLAAIWTAARNNAIDKDAVAEIVNQATHGETTSTSCLRRDEAIEVLRHVGGTTTVFQIKPRTTTRPATTRTAKKTIV